MFSLRDTGALLATAIMFNSAFAQDESAIPAQPGDGPAPRAGQDEGFYRASEILGTTVRGEDGQELGRIQDLLIERRNQRIRYFLLGDDEELNAQSNLRVVPWAVARPTLEGDDRFVTVRVDQQRWQQAPTFTFHEIQAGPVGWATEVDRFYGVTGRQGRGRVEVERDGDIEIEGRDRPRERGRRDRDRGNVEIERDGDVEIEGRRNRDRSDVRVGPNGIEVQGDGGESVRVDPGGVEVNPDREDN